MDFPFFFYMKFSLQVSKSWPNLGPERWRGGFQSVIRSPQKRTDEKGGDNETLQGQGFVKGSGGRSHAGGGHWRDDCCVDGAGGGRALRTDQPRARFGLVVEHDQERNQAGRR